MKKYLDPKWIFVFNTLPICAMIIIGWNYYEPIAHLFDPSFAGSRETHFYAILAVAAINVGIGIWSLIDRRVLTMVQCWLMLLMQVALTTTLFLNMQHLVNWEVNDFFGTDTVILFAGTFLMPSALYFLFLVVVHHTPDEKEISSWKNLLYAALVPLSWYVGSQIIYPLLHEIGDNFIYHLTAVLVAIGLVLFQFFLMRTIYLVVRRKDNFWKRNPLAWKIPLTIFFPLIGLILNQTLNSNGFTGNTGIFGNFGSVWFPILAFVNGLLLCLPSNSKHNIRLLLFIGRSITFTYTVYFFLVFIPFLPLSTALIIAVGTGILTLTPIALFAVHLTQIVKDFKFLKVQFSKAILIIIALAGAITIPSIITLNFLNLREDLHKSLNYLYSPDYTTNSDIDLEALNEVITKATSRSTRNFITLFPENNTPYITSYYNWLVLDNLTLSRNKINDIKRVFFNDGEPLLETETPSNPKIKISDVNVESTYNEEQQFWTSWIHLDIKNEDDNNLGEYSTTFHLPDGCWISDYYLVVNGKKEKGLLAEKKSAIWIYKNITTRRKDPGILYYLDAQNIQFKVFPFSKEETRQTGIQFIHKDPLTLQFDGNSLQLGDSSQHPAEQNATSAGNATYIPAKLKEALPLVKREPYYHFVVDCSIGNETKINTYLERINLFLESNGASKGKEKVWLVNHGISEISTDSAALKDKEPYPCEGGYYLDRAIRKILSGSLVHPCNEYPIIVTVSDFQSKAIITGNFSELRLAFPENPYFYHLTESRELVPHSLLHEPMVVSNDSTSIADVLAYPDKNSPEIYLPDNSQPSIFVKPGKVNIAISEVNEKEWTTGLMIHGQNLELALDPSTTQDLWKERVKNSFVSGIMSPVSSYIVVETEEQKDALLRKQLQMISGHPLEEATNEFVNMTEPGTELLIMLLITFLLIKSQRKMVS